MGGVTFRIFNFLPARHRHRGWISQYLPRFDGAWIQCNQHAYKQHSQTLVLSHGNYNAITQGCVNDNTHTDEMGSKIGVKTQN